MTHIRGEEALGKLEGKIGLHTGVSSGIGLAVWKLDPLGSADGAAVDAGWRASIILNSVGRVVIEQCL